MKKVLTVLLSVFVLLVIVVSCSPAPEKAEAKTTTVSTTNAIEEREYNFEAKFTCRDFRLLMYNTDVMTDAEMVALLKKVWIGSSMSHIAGLESTARELYSSVLNGDNTNMVSNIKIIKELCEPVPNPY
jgi:hypothetical protein